MNFRADQFQYQPEGKVYVAEISELGIGGAPRAVSIDGTGFTLSHMDRDASGEDVYGWNYVVTMGGVQNNPGMAGCRVLIIND